MGSSDDRCVALLAVRPKYADAIRAGLKRVEFRKRPFRREVEFVLLYSSGPVKRIVGFFQVQGITKATPQAIWEQFQHLGGVDEDAFISYYGNASTAVAITFARYVHLPRPMLLTTLSRRMKAPQSYTYLENALFTRFLNTVGCSSDFGPAPRTAMY